MIKAAVILNETDMGLAVVRSYVIYEYNEMTKTLTASLLREVSLPLGPEAGEHEGKCMVARQKSETEDVKVVHDVNSCLFLDLMGDYNVANKLQAIGVSNNDGIMEL
jgi:hypothetical protein